jgi:DNA-binding IclR family transcriptional regulator
MPRNTRQGSSSSETLAPAVERTVQLLRLLGQRQQGLSTQELIEATKTPRATLFRILRVLAVHGFVQRSDDDRALYQLGPAIARLGRQVPQPRNLVALAQPMMECLSKTVGETVKLVVLDGLEAVTVAVADSGLEARVTSRIGTRIPLYVGGSQRLLLAHAPASVRRQVLAMPLKARTAQTMSDSEVLRDSLCKLQSKTSIQSHGEGIEGIGAAAALVYGGNQTVLGAIVVVYIYFGKSAVQLRALLSAVESTAQEISTWQLTGC